MQENIDARICPYREAGKIRPLHGINNSPRIRNANHFHLESRNFAELKFPYVRYHDAAIENPGYALIDVSRLFPLFSADASDPASYDFGPTDDGFSGERLPEASGPEGWIEIPHKEGESAIHIVRFYRK